MADSQMAELLGLDVPRFVRVSMSMAAVAAVLAGWMSALGGGSTDVNGSLLTAATALAAAAMGGLHSPVRSAAAGLLAGFANEIWSWWFDRGFSGIAVLSALIFVLVVVQPAIIGRRPLEEA